MSWNYIASVLTAYPVVTNCYLLQIPQYSIAQSPFARLVSPPLAGSNSTIVRASDTLPFASWPEIADFTRNWDGLREGCMWNLQTWESTYRFLLPSKLYHWGLHTATSFTTGETFSPNSKHRPFKNWYQILHHHIH